MGTSLIIGVGGQDGTFLSQLLTRRGDRVIGVSRQAPNPSGQNAEATNILDPDQVLALVKKTQPAECYYLPAFHHSAEDASLSSSVSALFENSYAVHVRGLTHFLHAIAQTSKHTRLFYAASSHVFGSPTVDRLDEFTPLNPDNVYGITKTMGIHCCRYFRQELGVFAATGILFNHESHLRLPQFLSQKIVRGVLAFRADKTKKLVLGDLNASVDWGYAGDYVDAMTRILGHSTPEDFVVATGQTHTVGEFLQIACELAGVDWRECAVTDSRILKKKPVRLIGDYSKLQRLTGWRPTTPLRDIIKKMLEHAQAKAA